MITLKTLLVAQMVLVDAQTNTSSIIALLEEVGVPAFPAGLPSFTVFALFEREMIDPHQFDARIRIDLDGSQLMAVGVQADFRTFRRTRGIFRIDGLIVPTPGNLRFSIDEAGRDLGSYTVVVSAAAMPVSIPQPPRSRIN